MNVIQEDLFLTSSGAHSHVEIRTLIQMISMIKVTLSDP